MADRLDLLEARVAELEQRVAELERLRDVPVAGPICKYGVGRTVCRGCCSLLCGECVDFDQDRKMLTSRYCTPACAREHWELNYVTDSGGKPPAADYRLRVNTFLDSFL